MEPTLDNGSTNGVSIGSEMSGDVRNVTIVGLSVRRCAVGVYVKSMQGRGGVVEDVSFEDITTDRVAEPIRFAMDYDYRRRMEEAQPSAVGTFSAREDASPATASGNITTPQFRRLSVSRLRASHARVGGPSLTLSLILPSLLHSHTSGAEPCGCGRRSLRPLHQPLESSPIVAEPFTLTRSPASFRGCLALQYST